jgi:two-component system sensor histidine kinase EvgS
MTLCCRIGLLLFLAMQPLVLPAADMPAVPLIARGDRNFPPYEFINENGEPDGFNIDLLKAISRRLEMNVDIGLDAWETVREAFTNGNIHLVTGMIRSAEREKQFDFSITHAGVFYCLFVRKGSPIQTIDDARGKQILVHAQAYSQDWLVDRDITDQIIPVSSPQEALQMLADGRYDCAVVERLSALMLLDYFKIDNVALTGPPLTCAPYAFAVQKGNDRLLAKLNEGIHLMHQNGVYEDLYRKWFSVADAHARRQAMLRAGALMLAAVLGLAVAVFVWNIALKRMVRRRTTALRRSDNRFQELCDLLPQTVFETDAKGHITFLNRSGLDMLGLGEASIPNGIELSDFLPGEPDLDEWAQTGDCRGKACVVSGPDIEAFPALLYATPVVSGGIRSGLRGLLVDITFQKELEKQVIESQKLEALGRLAGGVAHDFSNIVTGISAYAQLLRNQPHHGDTVADRADSILTGCDRATDLVRHFLATAGRRQAEKEPVRLGQAVAEVFKLLHPTYGLSIMFHNTIDDENDTVWAEPALVFQVLMNLCVNSAQAMSDSGGTMTVGLMHDAAAGQAAPNTLPQRVIFIADTGPGIEPELQGRIFEPFFTTRGKDSGTGIGLFVVCQALSDMGGAVRVESEPGKGATFIVSLPAAQLPANGIVPDAPV